MKRVNCLYRVSTKKQVDNLKNDIPMQKKACRAFAEQQGWIITNEYYEKGVSGFKVSAEERDAVQDLREVALQGEFDVLLVYMFDRIGRIDSETPFVVEWFAAHGIEVWSVLEGQQRFESQADKLINYVRFWQANGESVKTSMRVKTAMAQMTAEGVYHGGTVPFGYRAVDKGRQNKRGVAVKDLEIDPVEAEYVKRLFDKTMHDGAGSYQLASYLNERRVKTHNGNAFSWLTVHRILRNKLYCGYYISGGVSSPKLTELTIVDENTFDVVQQVLDQRSGKHEEKKSIARTVRGQTLLSGNIVCGHCGCSLVSSSYTDKYTRKDGSVGETKGLRYMCYHRARRLNDCDGQSVYSAARIDRDVEKIVLEYLERIKISPREKTLELRCQKELEQRRRMHKEMLKMREVLNHRLKELSAEVGKCLTGESRFTVEILSESIDATKAELQQTEEKIQMCEGELEEKKDILGKLDFYYQQFISWADEFQSASRERKKMILCYLIDEVRVKKGYELEIKFNISYRQFITA